jgi:hypothetical protein
MTLQKSRVRNWKKESTEVNTEMWQFLHGNARSKWLYYLHTENMKCVAMNKVNQDVA